jgi:hypothetical protein
VQVGEGVLYVDAPAERAANITAVLAAQELYLHGLKVTGRSLESFFLDVTGNSSPLTEPH